MLRFRNRITNKIRGKAGETIAETLVALLIAALALVMLAGAITAAKNILQNNRTAFNKYYAQNETLMKRSGTGSDGVISVKEVDATGTVSTTELFPLHVLTFTNDELGNPVTAYKIKDEPETQP